MCINCYNDTLFVQLSSSKRLIIYSPIKGKNITDYYESKKLKFITDWKYLFELVKTLITHN